MLSTYISIFIAEDDQSLHLPLSCHRMQLSATIAEWQHCTGMIEANPSQPDVAWPSTALPVALQGAMEKAVVGEDCDSDDEADPDPDHYQSLLSHEVSAVLDNATQEIDTSDAESELGLENVR